MMSPLSWTIYPLAFLSGVGTAYAALRFLGPHVGGWLTQKEEDFENRLRELFRDPELARVLVLAQIAGAPALGVLVLWATDSLVFAAVAGGLVYVAPETWLTLLEKRRRERLEGQVLDLINSLTATTKAGMNLLQAVEEVATRMPPPMSQELGMVLERVGAGQTLSSALRACDRRVNLPNLKLVIQSVVVNQERGGHLTELLERLGESIRELERVEQRVKTETAGIKLSSRLMAAMPLVMGLFLYLASPDHVLMLFNTILGNVVLVVAGLLDYVGFAMIRKLGDLEV